MHRIHKIAHYLLRATFFLIAGGLIFLSLVFAIMQTKWARIRIQQYASQIAEEQGMHIECPVIEGRIPFHWRIPQLTLHIEGLGTIELHNIKMRLALFPLFHREVAISYFHADSGHAYLQQSIDLFSLTNSENISVEDLKAAIKNAGFVRIYSAEIDTFKVDNLKTGLSSEFTFMAKSKFRRRSSRFSVLTKLSTERSEITLSVEGDKRINAIRSTLNARVESLSLTRALFYLPFDLQGSFAIQLHGPWKTWQAIIGIHSASADLHPLQGSVTGAIEHLYIPNATVLDQKWDAQAIVRVNANGGLAFPQIHILSSLGTVSGEASFRPKFGWDAGRLHIAAPNLKLLNPLFPIAIGGAATGSLEYSQDTFSSEFQIMPLELEEFTYSTAHAMVRSIKENGQWQGKWEMEFEHEELPLHAESSFAFTSHTDISIDKLRIQGPDLECYGDLIYRSQYHIMEGSLYAQVKHLNRFQDFIKHMYVEGSLGLQAQFSSQTSAAGTPIQDIRINALCQHLRYNEFFVQEILVKADLYSLYDKPKGIVTLDAQRIFLPHLSFNTVSFSIKNQGDAWPYSLQAEGRWKEPLNLYSSGVWNPVKEGWQLKIERLEGEALSKPFHLDTDLVLIAQPGARSISPFLFRMDKGTLQGALSSSPDLLTLSIQAQQFPLDFLSLPLPHFSLKGTTTVDASLNIRSGNAQGAVQMSLESAQLLSSEVEKPFQAKGACQLHLNQDIAQVHAHFVASNAQFFDWTGTFPVRMSTQAPFITLDKEKPLASELTMEGNLEEVFDFINFGTHRFSGLLSCHMLLSKNIAHPSLNGIMEVHDGSYENYFTGTTLEGLEARFIAENDKIAIASISASDGADGLVKGEGAFMLHPQDHFPYNVQLVLKNLNALKFDALTANFTGPMEILGTSESAGARGQLKVTQADIYIPDEFPADIPELPIQFIHQPGHLKFQETLSPKVFPFYLDLDLDATENVFVKGRGLESSWEGKVHASGTNMNFILDGKLNLKKGDFSFSGKKFDLTQGEITFSDKAGQAAFISLSGLLTLPDLSVTANLRGPLTAPTLTFQSVPPQSTSTILAYILFNKDLSDINPLQALQIAQTIVTLSGGAGPGVLEQIRKSLGVDKLTIIAGPEGLDDLAVQIGKYLMKGVMITLSQGSGASSVIVEVELAKGFVFQAETQYEEEGKFSLKWNRNY